MYDYVIVGAGSAGCVLAARLSEDPAAKVLLLEAGESDGRREIRIPAAFPKLFKSSCDWAYYTEPQACLHNRSLYWPRGKVLGGCSSINAMIYIRGNPRDYDRWQELGNKGWGFSEVLPYFKKSEDQENGASEYHGSGGPLRVCDCRCINPLARAFVEAGVELGLARNPDFNGSRQEGVGFYQLTQKNGSRHSAADAYLRPAVGRQNLTVRTGAHTTRVLLEKGRAVGVEFVRGGKQDRVHASQEVVLCGGSINSPQLLMISGIGPADQLRSLGIPVVADLPGVGQNLQDHLFLAVAYQCTRPVTLDRADGLANLLKYLLFKTGPFTSNIAEAGGFIRTIPDLSTPDLQFHFGAAYYLEHGRTRPQGHGFTLGPTLIQPRSRGFVALASSDPFRPPRIQPNYLQDAADLQVLMEGVKLARRLAQAKPFAEYRGAEFCPGAAVQSEAELADYVRNAVETVYHPVGTCRMGNDPMAVVNSRLQVHGIEHLRVVDASVMPVIPSGNTNAPVIMTAEKAADMMRRAG